MNYLKIPDASTIKNTQSTAQQGRVGEFREMAKKFKNGGFIKTSTMGKIVEAECIWKTILTACTTAVSKRGRKKEEMGLLVDRILRDRI